MNLAETLRLEHIKLPLTGMTKVEVIRELLELMVSSGQVTDTESVLQAIMDREKIMTTGVGKGVAIPHCKSNTLAHFALALGVHPGGVDFQSIDDRAAHVIFLLVGPDSEPGVHIRLLSRISRIISRDEIRESILHSQSGDEVYELMRSEESAFLELHS